jgi:hypothetical protein
MKFIIGLFFLSNLGLFGTRVRAQPTSSVNTIQFGFEFGEGRLQTAEESDNPNQPPNACLPFCITDLKFYIGNIKFIQKGAVVLEASKKYHLIDINIANSMRIIVPNEQNFSFDALSFDIGIDKATNVAGVMGGDLDPTKGMYWAWQSGYINFKLEGNSKLCTTRKNEFQFHLGGYQEGENCLQTLTLPITHPNEINIQLDVQKILQAIDLSKINHIMSPSQTAVLLSKIVAEAFTIL